MDLQKEKKDLQEFLRLTFPEFKSEVQVVERTDEQPVMYHISTDPSIDVFTPRVAARSGGKVEDTTLPRICVAPSVLECYIGYGNAIWDFEWATKREDKFLGGYYIYALPYRLALKPSPKLLSDVTRTNEHWLVGYNTRRFKTVPDVVGKTWIGQVNKRRVGEAKEYDIALYVEVYEDQQIRLNDDIVLSPGYWQVDLVNQKDDVFWRTKKSVVSVTGLTEQDYLSRKNVAVSLLSREYKPPTASW